jgi:hypothetical protein
MPNPHTSTPVIEAVVGVEHDGLPEQADTTAVSTFRPRRRTRAICQETDREHFRLPAPGAASRSHLASQPATGSSPTRHASGRFRFRISSRGSRSAISGSTPILLTPAGCARE